MIITFSFSIPIAYADLFSYLKKPDKSFAWNVKDLHEEQDIGYYELKMTSQEWMNRNWTHSLEIIKPKFFSDQTTAIICVSEDMKYDNVERLVYAGKVAKGAGLLTSVLYDVPNQPLFDNLREDALISYTFDKYLKEGNDDWIILFPMVKSVVRAMDTLQAFAKKKLGLEIDKFILVGGSKRSWISWLTAIIDPRVISIIPIVYDDLNLRAQLKHQLSTWMAYSEQFKNYNEKGVSDKIVTASDKGLANKIDPFTWKDRLTVPKLIINGTNDSYRTLDALNLYFDNLKGEKYIFYAPNCTHKVLTSQRVFDNIIAFCLKAIGNLEFPILNWDFKELKGKIYFTLSSDIEPTLVKVWMATSNTKDFRNAKWQSFLVNKSKNDYLQITSIPKEGYLAIFGEANYEVNNIKFSLSTNIHISSKLENQYRYLPKLN